MAALIVSRKRGRENDVSSIANWELHMGRPVNPIYLLFECATGYALFHAKDVFDVNYLNPGEVEEYINSTPDPLELIAYLPFSSDNDALNQFKAVLNANVTDKLLNFIDKYSLKPNNRHSLALTDACMGSHIVRRIGLGSRCSVMFLSIMRAVREKIHQFIQLQPGQLERAQINLARLYNNQTRTKMGTKCPVVSSSSYIQERVSVVPHIFKGLFNVKGDEDILCTRNLVPGEAIYGEKLVHVQNEDGPEVEYRVWDPLRSKLAAAIHRGVTNIWIKPGSRVLYIGNVCGLTVSDLSDLVGLEGLVYVVGFSDDVVDMAGKRPNVLTIKAKEYVHYHYRTRMLVGMVAVMFAEVDLHSKKQFDMEGPFVCNNACFYLRAGGHYMISRPGKVMKSTGRFIFAVFDNKKEFKPIETVMLDKEGTYALDVGGYRMPKE